MKEKLEHAVGDAVFIRTVTYHYTGRIVALTHEAIVLDHAAWIADSGRPSVAFATGFDRSAEIEPYPAALRVHISRGAIIEVSEWPHALPATVQ